ncbi:Rieske (2Fe-2S) protein [Rothia sp. P7208]|uniref:Rieske (2Fe-2S) protein n=1 Tax=Rothia sp. P7208 TaxID=3402660 RepID=UPI003AD68154
MSGIPHEGMSRRTILGSLSVGTAGVALTACAQENTQLQEAEGPQKPTDMASVSDVPVGGAYKATAEGVTVMLTQPKEGTFKAFSSACTHQGCQLNVQATILACPCHASQFSIDDGTVIGGPAPTQLPEYPTEVKDGRIFVG